MSKRKQKRYKLPPPRVKHVNADEAPASVRKLLNRVAESDTRTFEAEPGLREFSRPFVPGELWPTPDPPGCYAVRVFLIGGNTRARIPICEGDEATA